MTRKTNTLTRTNIQAVPLGDPAFVLIRITGHEWDWNPKKRQRMLDRITRLQRSENAKLAST